MVQSNLDVLSGSLQQQQPDKRLRVYCSTVYMGIKIASPSVVLFIGSEAKITLVRLCMI